MEPPGGGAVGYFVEPRLVRPEDHTTRGGLWLLSSTRNSMNARRKPTPLGKRWPVRFVTWTLATTLSTVVETTLLSMRAVESSRWIR